MNVKAVITRLEEARRINQLAIHADDVATYHIGKDEAYAYAIRLLKEVA